MKQLNNTNSLKHFRSVEHTPEMNGIVKKRARNGQEVKNKIQQNDVN